MNEQAQQSLAELIKYAASGVDAMVAFGQEQLPILVEQLLVWHFVKSAAIGLLGIILVVSSILCLIWIAKEGPGEVISEQGRFGNKHHKETLFYDRDGDSNGLKAISMFLSLPIMAGLFMMWQIFTAAQILIAPKLYLFEYGASLVK